MPVLVKAVDHYLGIAMPPCLVMVSGERGLPTLAWSLKASVQAVHHFVGLGFLSPLIVASGLSRVERLFLRREGEGIIVAPSDAGGDVDDPVVLDDASGNRWDHEGNGHWTGSEEGEGSEQGNLQGIGYHASYKQIKKGQANAWPLSLASGDIRSRIPLVVAKP